MLVENSKPLPAGLEDKPYYGTQLSGVDDEDDDDQAPAVGELVAALVGLWCAVPK